MPSLYEFAAVVVLIGFAAWIIGSFMGVQISLEVADLAALLDGRPALELSGRTP